MAQGYKDFTAGAVLTAADLEDYNQNQSVMRFATAAARDSALTTVKVEGMMAYLIDSNTVTVYNGSAWSTIGPVHGALTTFVPTWTNLTVGNGVLNICSYQRIGRTIHNYKVRFTFGTTTAVTGAITVSTPFAAEGNVTEYECCQNVIAYDSSAVQRHPMYTASVSTTSFKFRFGGADTSSTVPFTWATGDIIFFSITYEAAADA